MAGSIFKVKFAYFKTCTLSRILCYFQKANDVPPFAKLYSLLSLNHMVWCLGLRLY
jgi:hypothetical protein